jgi:pimeloyl-ACP methyl ester carboxylesterase
MIKETKRGFTMTEAGQDVRPFTIAISQQSLDDLKRRLDQTRFTTDIPGSGADDGASADYGTSLDLIKRLVEYWRDGYDWRAFETRLNGYPNFITNIDGQDIHFLHVRSPEPDALPLIVTHGWPGSVAEYLDVIGPLTDPRAHGRDPAVAFDLVIPSLPGFAFSAPLRTKGWGTQRTAAAWVELMHRLNYHEKYGAVGNDAGSMISPEIGRRDPEHVVGVHVTQVFSFPSGNPNDFQNLDEADQAALAKLQWFMDHKISFNQLHSQQPQTIAHALADSPAGLLGWNVQLMADDAMGERSLDDDFILDNTSLYWLTNTGGESIRFYYEDAHAPRATEPTTIPLGLAGFKGDFSGVRRFAERDHKHVVQWNLHPQPAGHYAAHQEPQVLADDIRNFYNSLA